MNKKGFVLIETIVVIVIISVSLLTLFSSYNKILNKLKTENRFDTPEYLYMTNYIKDRMSKLFSNPDKFDFSKSTSSSGESADYDYLSSFTSSEQGLLTNIFNVKHIYLVTGIGHTNTDNNLKKFPPTVVEYLKKLDVTVQDSLIVVVYERNEVDNKLVDKNIYCTTSTGGDYCTNSKDDKKILKKTFISSLRW